MVSAVALSSVIASAGFCPNASFAERGAAHKTLMLTTASDARTIAPSTNPNRLFMKSPLGTGIQPLRLQPVLSRERLSRADLQGFAKAPTLAHYERIRRAIGVT